MRSILKKNKIKKARFRGSGKFQVAHQHILSHPFKSERAFFSTHDFTDDQIFWPLESASTRTISISTVTDLLREKWSNCPSGEVVLKCIREIPEIEIEALCNRVLFSQFQKLPAKVRNELEHSGLVVFDKHEDPYWGDAGKVTVIKGEKQHDSYYHFVYLTADLISEHYRFTIFILPCVEGFSTFSHIKPAIETIQKVIKIRRILFDGEFPTKDVLLHLDQSSILWTARFPRNKKVKNVLMGYALDSSQFLHPRWHLTEINGTDANNPVAIYVTAYELHGIIKVITKSVGDDLPAEEAIKLYQRRFTIDGGYKEKHSFQARTSSRSWIVRLVLFLVSVLLWNVWRLALAWDFTLKISVKLVQIPLNLTRRILTHDLSEFFVEGWWKL